MVSIIWCCFHPSPYGSANSTDLICVSTTKKKKQKKEHVAIKNSIVFLYISSFYFWSRRLFSSCVLLSCRYRPYRRTLHSGLLTKQTIETLFFSSRSTNFLSPSRSFCLSLLVAHLDLAASHSFYFSYLHLTVLAEARSQTLVTCRVRAFPIFRSSRPSPAARLNFACSLEILADASVNCMHVYN